MFEEVGKLFGWLIVLAFAGTIMNYCVKFIVKRYGKQVSAYPYGKKAISLALIIFVRNHRYFGFATLLFIVTHFITEYIMSGLNWTGIIAAILILCQVGLGLLTQTSKKPRSSATFIAHRFVAALLIMGIMIHVLAPKLF